MTTIVLEDGTGKENANSFVSLADAKARWILQGRASDHTDSDDNSIGVTVNGTDYLDAAIEAAIIRATFYISESFQWAGYKRWGRRTSNSRFQALAWPRYGAYDDEGLPIDNDEIPREIVWATIEVALYELENPGGLQPTYTATDRVMEEQAGSVRVKYDVSQKNEYAARPVLLSVQDLIGPFLRKTGGRLSGATARG